jgi:hypothetical protein
MGFDWEKAKLKRERQDGPEKWAVAHTQSNLPPRAKPHIAQASPPAGYKRVSLNSVTPKGASYERWKAKQGK